MNNIQFNRFFDLVGNDSVSFNEQFAAGVSKETFINETMKLVSENPIEYENVAGELEYLTELFWNSINN